MQRVALRGLCIVLLIFLVISGTGYGQSLADAARANRKQKGDASAKVISSEPNKCNATAPNATAIRPDCSNVTTSTEKVENVVRPPQKPVATNKRHSGAMLGDSISSVGSLR